MADGPDMNPERLPSGTLLEDVGCPHCGKVCDVCCTYDEENAALRGQLAGAVQALRQVRRAALSTAGGDRERYRAKVTEVIEITGAALGGR